MTDSPKTDPEIIFRYPANWTLVVALAVGVAIGAALLLLWASTPNTQPEENDHAG